MRRGGMSPRHYTTSVCFCCETHIRGLNGLHRQPRCTTSSLPLKRICVNCGASVGQVVPFVPIILGMLRALLARLTRRDPICLKRPQPRVSRGLLISFEEMRKASANNRSSESPAAAAKPTLTTDGLGSRRVGGRRFRSPAAPGGYLASL